MTHSTRVSGILLPLFPFEAILVCLTRERVIRCGMLRESVSSCCFSPIMTERERFSDKSNTRENLAPGMTAWESHTDAGVPDHFLSRAEVRASPFSHAIVTWTLETAFPVDTRA